VAAQVRQSFANLGAVLAAAGKSLDDVLRVGVYLTDMADYASMNEAYAEQFRQPYPARTAIAVAGLPLGARVEIDAVAD
jgi:2-iminobutanoate/2-iminopropanoate deaminase